MLPGLSFAPVSKGTLRLSATTVQTLPKSVHSTPRCPTLRVGPARIQYRGYRRQFNRDTYNRTRGYFQRWARHPYFYYHCAGIGGAASGFYLYNIEEVPVSGRRRFNIISDAFLETQGDALYQQQLQEFRGHFLPEHHPYHRTAERVLERLIPHSGLSPENNKWELHVIADPNMVNAFVIPGGKVFVGAGMFKICDTDDMLAAVLGHEISHNLAKHMAERFSLSSIVIPLSLLVSVLLGVGDFANITQTFADLALVRPNGRKQESEADHIGLLMMAEACYDPRAALDLWERMDKMAEQAPPQFMSTHPSNYNRREAIRGWLEAAEAKRENAGCGPTAGWAGDFKKSIASWQQP